MNSAFGQRGYLFYTYWRETSETLLRILSMYTVKPLFGECEKTTVILWRFKSPETSIGQFQCCVTEFLYQTSRNVLLRSGSTWSEKGEEEGERGRGQSPFLVLIRKGGGGGEGEGRGRGRGVGRAFFSDRTLLVFLKKIYTQLILNPNQGRM